ncbi:MAG: cysteine synthase A [Spirochaetales bacterium]|nr:cysteine synthase A [Spirochaetales bacterium]
MKIDTILEAIGNTPHLKLNHLFGDRHEVWMKLERSNPGGSIKDRIALSMVEAAERDGLLSPGGTIIEPTSGNTGVGLALVGAVKGYRVILVMPESMSMERRRLMAVYGARFELTPRGEGMKGAIQRAEELAAELDGAWMPMQFANPANPEIHEERTASEIVEDFPDALDYVITGVGTGGHITGVARRLKRLWPDVRIIAVEPADSPVLSGGEPASHAIQGIGAGFVPEVMDRSLLDGVATVTKAEAFEYARRAAREEGALIGISSGASLAAVAKTLADETEPRRVLTFCYDTGERYLSMEDFYM